MKILKIVGIVLLVLFVTLFSLPFLLKGKIVTAAKKAVNEQLNAKVDFNEEIGLSLFSSFPNLALSIKDFRVINIAPFEGDTLFAAKEISAVLDVMSVIRGEQIQVRSIVLNQPRINALVQADGKANWDIAKTDTTADLPQDTATSSFSLKLRKLQIKDANLVYNDKQSDMRAELNGLNYRMEGDFSETLMTMISDLKIAALTYEMEGIAYLNKAQAAMDGTLQANLSTMKFEFKEHNFRLNALELGLDGFIAMPSNDIEMDLKWNAKKNEIAQFLSLIPAVYASDMKDLQTKGKLTLNGFVKGIYNDKLMPAFGLNLLLENAWFKYSALPAPMEDLQMKLAISNPDGEPDHTKIDLEKLHWLLQGDAFDAKLLALTPITDPYVDAVLKGSINLGNIAKLVPLPQGTKLAGNLVADVMAKGNMSTLEKGNYEAFDAKGNLQVKQFVYEASDLPKPFYLNDAALSFSPKVVTLQNFDAKIGNSDMQMNGALENFYAYYLGNATLKGNLNFNSKHFDANEWLSEDGSESTTAEDTAAMALVEVPDNIDFQLKSNIDKLNYTNLEITNFKGGIHVANRQIDFQQVALQLLGSNMKMDGYYETKDLTQPKVKMDFSMSDLDIQQAFKTFNTVQKIAPIAAQMAGRFNASFRMYTSLSQHMQPIYESLLAEGTLGVPQATLTNISSLNKVADFVGKPEYKQMSMNNAKIAWKVINGKIYTEPFDLKLGAQTMRLSGNTSLSQQIEYIGTMNVPRKDLGGANTAINETLKQLNASAGSNIKMDENLPLVFNIGGTFVKPEIKTNLKDLLVSQAGSLKDQAMDEAKRKAKEMEDKARAEAQKQMQAAKDKAIADAQKAKSEAEAKLNAEKEKLRLEAEAKKKEAEAKAKAEADRLKKQAEEEAKKKLKGLLK